MNYLLTAQLQTLPEADFVNIVKADLAGLMAEGTEIDLAAVTQLDGGVEARLWLKLPASLSEGDPNKVQDAIHTAKQAIQNNFDPHCTVIVKAYPETVPTVPSEPERESETITPTVSEPQ